ncbi:MAG: glycosyltransferase [Bacteroidales bacterium]|nr:glycosyltransferase [Bacteroidales bacterium]
MKILLSNKFYYPRGGAEVYVINLESLLREHGHEVAVFSMQHPQNLPSVYEKYFPKEVDFTCINLRNLFTYILRPLGSKEVRDKFSCFVDEFCPDVVHLNNTHSQLSPVIVEIAHKKGIKIVWTLHDYKLLCPRYDCLCRGKTICEKCFTDKKQVIKNRCMKDSLMASAIAYCEAVKWTRQRLEKYTDTFICPSRFMYNKMTQGGFDTQKLHALCNFVDVGKTKGAAYSGKEDYYCYIGRLSHEKGIETLLNAASQLPYKLKIVGDGPLRKDLEKRSSKQIEFAGYRQWTEIKEIVGEARFIVVPSEWYENNPLSIIESLCLGTPVLGANIGGILEMIEEGKNGMLFESRNVEDLRDKIQKMFTLNFDYKSIAEAAQQQYSGENHYKELIKIYNKQ